MFTLATLAAFTGLLSVASASPLETRGGPITLPITRVKPPTDAKIAVGHADRARAAEFIAGRYGKAGTATKTSNAAAVSATNILDTYTLAVEVGSPATTYNLLIDTGSSNTWLGAGTAYKATSSSTNTKDKVSVSYGSGTMSGTEYLDTVNLGGGLTIKKQSIGVASSTQGFEGVDGIIGIGPVDLTEDTVSRTTTVPTVTDNLYSQGTIAQEVIGIYYAPSAVNGDVNGELTFGGIDTSKTTSAVTYTPITTTSPASAYWGIDQTISYGTTQLLNSAGIVDTGTTLVLLATDVFDKYMADIKGSTVDQNSGLLEIPASAIASMKTLVFNIGGTAFEFSPTDQLLDQALNTYYGGSATAYYSVVADLGSPSGQGLDFINGYLFLERFYSVFDTTNSRVGFATTANS